MREWIDHVPFGVVLFVIWWPILISWLGTSAVNWKLDLFKAELDRLREHQSVLSEERAETNTALLSRIQELL